jgi:hypothetical protein
VCFGERKESFKTSFANVIALNKLIKKALGWDDVTIAPPKHHVHFNLYLKGIGMHTCTGMIGYYLKDQGEEHFQFCHRNVSFEHIQGVDEYVKYGSCFCKNRICLTHNNIMERIVTFCKYKMKKKIGNTLLGVILEMLRFGQFYPIASWVCHTKIMGCKKFKVTIFM